MSLDRRSRWAISFADLSLLLLGFFVLLHAGGQRSRAVLAGVGAQFGARPMVVGVDLPAEALFLPGEAMLSASGKARISAVAARFSDAPAVELGSSGQDRATRRFDGWDLAAARVGAVARSLKASGIAEDRLLIRGLDQRGGEAKGQVIRIAPATLPKR